MTTTFGERLQAARKRAGYRTQQALGDVIGVSGRTIRNYELNKTVPDLAALEELRAHLGAFDSAGDDVEAAVRRSELVEWRQDTVLGFYKRNLSEQREDEGRRTG